jgi:hypothetical protein
VDARLSFCVLRVLIVVSPGRNFKPVKDQSVKLMTIISLVEKYYHRAIVMWVQKRDYLTRVS